MNPRNFWMVVTSPENFRITRDLGFSVQGIKARQRRKAQRMAPPDRMLYYLTGVKRFAGTATVTGEYLEERTALWKDTGRGIEYPYRIPIQPNIMLEEPLWLDARELAPRLEYVRKWPPEHWHLAFQGQLHLLLQRDFRLIEEEIRKVAAKAGQEVVPGH